MKLDDIIEMWEEDSVIDKTNLVGASLTNAKLHNKYYKIYIKEKLLLLKLNSDLKGLWNDLYDYYAGSISQETLKERGLEPNPKTVKVKSMIPSLIEGDQHYITQCLRIGIQNEKVAYLETICKSISNRSYHITNAIAALKFENGE